MQNCPEPASSHLVLHPGELELAASLESVTGPALITRAELNLPGPTIISVTGALCELTGYTREELLGRTPRLFQGPLTDRRVLDKVRVCCERGEQFSGEAVNYRKDGSAYLQQWAISPVHGKDGRITHFISLQKDITGERPYVAQWLASAAQAQAALRAANAQMSVIAEAILVLERTKRSFRSAELGALRQKLAAAARPGADAGKNRP